MSQESESLELRNHTEQRRRRTGHGAEPSGPFIRRSDRVRFPTAICSGVFDAHPTLIFHARLGRFRRRGCRVALPGSRAAKPLLELQPLRDQLWGPAVGPGPTGRPRGLAVLQHAVAELFPRLDRAGGRFRGRRRRRHDPEQFIPLDAASRPPLASVKVHPSRQWLRPSMAQALGGSS